MDRKRKDPKRKLSQKELKLLREMSANGAWTLNFMADSLEMCPYHLSREIDRLGGLQVSLADCAPIKRASGVWK